MVELVDAPDSKSNGSNTVRDRVSLRPPKKKNLKEFNSLVDLQKGNKYYPYYSAFFTFVFFVIMGSIPLIPFLFVSLQNETMMQNMLLCFGLLAFVIIGTIKGIYTKKIVKSLIEVILIGSLGAFIAFYVSKTMKERYLLN